MTPNKTHGDLLERLQHAQNVDELYDALEQRVRQLGFDHFAYGLKSPYPLTSPKTELINNYPTQWQQDYSDKQYLATDPTVQHGLRSIQPLIWTESVYSAARPLWEDARSFGLNHGWAQACRDAQGNIGMLTLARSSEIISATELQDKSADLSWLAQLAHAGFCKFLIPDTQRNKPKLTAREIEILRWTAEGKTSNEVGTILNIRPRTINFHINNVLKKLGSANKTAAVAQAALMGLLT